MRSLLIVLVILLHSKLVFGQVEFEWAFVGDPENPKNEDYQQIIRGTVDYEYLISKHEVTNEQYAEFLNHVALEDPHELFTPLMRIRRSGTSGNYNYSPEPGYERHPVTYIRFFDAMRFVNWLENGQGLGGTEDGTYAVTDGATETRAPNSTYFIPSENEWHKAAYYDPTLNDGEGGYWRWATQNDDIPSFVAPPGGTNSINASDSNLDSTTEVGAYENSTSYYGTFDQTGNVFEWIEDVDPNHPFRGMRGGSWLSSAFLFSLNTRPSIRSTVRSGVGFRVASRVDTFRRGDCNDDSTVDISDPIFTLRSLFLTQEHLNCEDACDANDDGEISLSDAVLAFEELFQIESPIPAPGASDCGFDPTTDGMRCLGNKSCL